MNGLGRDFWLYRLGQIISVVGDSCGLIAMSWWILDVTGSAAKMGSIIAPAMFARLALTPLLGPLGDRFPRKKLIIAGDAWRGLLSIILAGMAYCGIFNLPAAIAIYVLMGAGSAFFSAGAAAIVPQLVAREKLSLAISRSEAVNSAGQILGGAVGGILVSLLGVAGAFLADGLSYFAAVGASALIAADTKPQRAADQKQTLAAWRSEFSSGIRALAATPPLLWVGVLAAFINFAFSPVTVGLPVLVKEIRHMPPWFLGSLESSVSCGFIIGSFAVASVCRKFRGDVVSACALALIGLGLAALPWAPNVLLPVFVMFLLGAMMALVNIPLQTRMTLSIPDNYRSRVMSCIFFLCGAISPAGVAITGFAVSAIGLNKTFLAGGLAIMVLAPLFLLLPGMKEFLSLPESEMHGYLERKYPRSFLR